VILGAMIVTATVDAATSAAIPLHREGAARARHRFIPGGAPTSFGSWMNRMSSPAPVR
jgi:hypothetical protein